jgi:transposase-like protein
VRPEGIYHSLLSKWRQQRAEGIDLGLSEKPRGVKGPSVKTLQAENRKLQRQKARLEESCGALASSLNFKKRPQPCSSRRRRPRRVNGIASQLSTEVGISAACQSFA